MGVGYLNFGREISDNRTLILKSDNPFMGAVEMWIMCYLIVILHYFGLIEEIKER